MTLLKTTYITLLLCMNPLTFCSQEQLNIIDKNIDGLRFAIGSCLHEDKKNALCILNYFKSSSARDSASEMLATTTTVAKGFMPKDEYDESYMRLYQNVDNPDSQLFFIMKEQQWKTIDQLDKNSAPSFINGSSLNCKIAIYNIPHNNILSMTEHMKAITKVYNQNCHSALIVNIDSSIQDDYTKFLPNNTIRVIIGAQKKLAHFLYRHKGKIFLFGGIMLTFLAYIWYARKCAYEKAIMNGYAG